MNATLRMASGAATAVAVISCGQLIPTTALAGTELHNVTYTVRVDGVAPGSMVTFRINDDQTNTAPLGTLPGSVFEAHTVLSDASAAGAQVSIPWPYSANVHCEIDVDDAVAVQSDQFVTNGVLGCGAPLSGTGGGAPA